MKKYRTAVIAFFMAAGVIGLSGCGQIGTEESTTVEVTKNGGIVSTIVEDFDKEYYAEEGLRTMIESEITEYNLTEGSDAVMLEKLSAKNGIATSVISYKDARTYADFNEMVFFYGTVAQAYDEGYSFDVLLTNTADETQTLDKNAILGEGTTHILLMEEPQNIKVYKNISYKSDNVTLSSKKEAAAAPEEGNLAYILLK